MVFVYFKVCIYIGIIKKWKNRCVCDTKQDQLFFCAGTNDSGLLTLDYGLVHVTGIGLLQPTHIWPKKPSAVNYLGIKGVVAGHHTNTIPAPLCCEKRLQVHLCLVVDAWVENCTQVLSLSPSTPRYLDYPFDPIPRSYTFCWGGALSPSTPRNMAYPLGLQYLQYLDPTPFCWGEVMQMLPPVEWFLSLSLCPVTLCLPLRPPIPPIPRSCTF